MALESRQTQRRRTEMSGHEDPVARLRAIPGEESRAGHAGEGERKEYPGSGGAGVPADEREAETARGCPQASAQTGCERPVEPRRQGQRKQGPEGPAAHGCNVAGVHGSEFPPQIGGTGPTTPEVNTLCEQVRREQQPGAARRLHHRRIVTGTDDDRGFEPGAGPSRRAAENAHNGIFPDQGQWHIPPAAHGDIVARKH